MIKVNLKRAFACLVRLARKIRTRSGSRTRREGTELVSDNELEDPNRPVRRPPWSNLSKRIRNMFKRADRDTEEALVLPSEGMPLENRDQPGPRSPSRLVDATQLDEGNPSIVVSSIVVEQTSALPHHGQSSVGPGVFEQETSSPIAGPSTLQPPFATVSIPVPSDLASTGYLSTISHLPEEGNTHSATSPAREGSSASFMDLDEVNSYSVYHTPQSVIYSSPYHSGESAEQVNDPVFASDHGHINSDEEEEIQSQTTSRVSSPSDHDPRASRATLPISDSRASSNPQRASQLTRSSESSSFSLSRHSDRSCTPLSLLAHVKSLPPISAPHGPSAATRALVLASDDAGPSTRIPVQHRRSINDILPFELIERILNQSLLFPVGSVDDVPESTRTRCQLRCVCFAWNDLITKSYDFWPSIAPISLSPCIRPGPGYLSWYDSQIGINHLSLPLGEPCPDPSCRDFGPFHRDHNFVRILSSAISKCQAVKISLPRDLLLLPEATTAIPTSRPTPNLRYFSWTSNQPISEPIRPDLGLPWFALRHAQHGPKWSLLTTVVLDCPLTIEDCLYVLSAGQDSLEYVTFETVDELGPAWTSTVVLPRLLSFSIEGVADLHHLFSLLMMDCQKRMALTSHRATPHALNIRWDCLTHVDLSCHLTHPDLVGLIGGLRDVVSFRWRGDLDVDAVTHTKTGHNLDHLAEVIIHSNIAGCEAVLNILTESRRALLRKISIDKPTPHFTAPSKSLPGEWPNDPKLAEMKAALHCVILNNVRHPICISDAWSIVSQCPELKVLDIYVGGRVPSSELANKPSPKLQTLKLNLDVGVSVLFQNLSLPNLATLEITFSDSIHIHCMGLGGALERWGCPLKRLLLRNSNLHEEDLIKCLKPVSSTLQELLIYGFGPPSGPTVGKLALQRLTHEHGQLYPNLCPKLEILTVVPCIVEDGAVARLLRSRAPPTRSRPGPMCASCAESTPLHRVRFFFPKPFSWIPSEPHDEDLNEMRFLRAEGMDIDFSD